MTQPITPEQLAGLLLAVDARVDHFGQHASRAEWTTTDGATWTISVSWNPQQTGRVAIHGPNAAVTLTAPTAHAVAAHLAVLGAIEAAPVLGHFKPDADLPAEILLFAERYITAWYDGDVGQRTRVVDQLHTALQRTLTGGQA